MWLAIWGMRVFPDIVGIEVCFFVFPFSECVMILGAFF